LFLLTDPQQIIHNKSSELSTRAQIQKVAFVGLLFFFTMAKLFF